MPVVKTQGYSLDLSVFHVRDLAETGRDLADRVYHSLPQRARQGAEKTAPL